MASYSGTSGKVYILSGSSSAGVNSTACVVRTRGGEWFSELPATDYSKRFWDPSQVPTVNIGASATTAYNRILYNGGVIVWSTNPTGTVTVPSFKYFNATAIGDAKEWSLDLECDTVEVTGFGDTWKEYLPTVKGGSGSVGKFFNDGTTFANLTAGTKIGLSLEIAPNISLNFSAYMTGDSISASYDGVVEESFDFTLFGEVALVGSN